MKERRNGLFWMIVGREEGSVSADMVRESVIMKRTGTIELSKKRRVEGGHIRSITWMSLDPSEDRYLLSCDVGSRISLCDLRTLKGKKLFFLDREKTHQFMISCVEWYPHDSGIFYSGSFDKKVKVWDTNNLTVVQRIQHQEKIFNIAVRDSLVVIGSGGQRVRICDVRTGRTCHWLTGHREAVWVCKWAPNYHYVLATGSKDHSVLFWDIRKAGPLFGCNQHSSSRSSSSFAPSFQPHVVDFNNPRPTAHDGPVTGLVFSGDGQFLYTSGKDNRLRRFETYFGRDTLVNYAPATRNSSVNCAHQLAISSNAEVVYYPDGLNIQPYRTSTGQPFPLLKGHFERVNSILFHHHLEEMYSAACDGHILVWVPAEDNLRLLFSENADQDHSSGEENWEDDIDLSF